MKPCVECNLVGGCWCETETVKQAPMSITLERTPAAPAETGWWGSLDTLSAVARLAYSLGIPGYAPIEWFDSIRVLGQVQYWKDSQQIIRVRFSSTVWPYLSPAERYDVVLHEVAHAKTVGHNHDHVWKAAYRAMGGTGEREADALPLDVQARISKWEGSCPNGHLYYRGRLTQRARNESCGKCSPRVFNPNYRLIWRQLR